MSSVSFVFVLHVPPKCLIHHRILKKGVLEGGKNGKKAGREIDGGDRREREGRWEMKERGRGREGREKEATETIRE